MSVLMVIPVAERSEPFVAVLALERFGSIVLPQMYFHIPTFSKHFATNRTLVECSIVGMYVPDVQLQPLFP